MQSYKYYYMVSPQTVFTYPIHLAKIQILLHGVTANSLYLSFSPCKATNITTWCHRKQSLLILFTMQSYKYYYMVSPQTVFTYPFHHAKLQILLHGVTANSLYLSFSPCKVTNITTWCHRKQSLLILFTMQSYKYYYMVSPQTVFTYPFHHAKLQILLHGVTANSLYLSFSPCKATNITTWCHRKQSLLILFTMQSYKYYYMVSPQTVFTYPFHHAKWQILLHGVTANSLYLSFSPCKATNITTWCHRKQSLLILFIMQSYKYYYMVSPQTVFTYPFHHAKLQILLHGVTANSLYLSFSPCKATNITTWCHRKQSLLILFTMVCKPCKDTNIQLYHVKMLQPPGFPVTYGAPSDREKKILSGVGRTRIWGRRGWLASCMSTVPDGGTECFGGQYCDFSQEHVLKREDKTLIITWLSNYLILLAQIRVGAVGTPISHHEKWLCKCFS